MIVNVNGWLFIVCAVLAPFLAADMPYGAGGSRFMDYLGAVFCGSIGVGLLMRQNWARWLALGSSLLTWTVGSVAILFMLPDLMRPVYRARGLMPAVIFLLIFGALCGAAIVLSFKLFHYLTSDEGKEEFKTPASESRAVLKSTSFYVVLTLIFAVIEYQRMSEYRAAGAVFSENLKKYELARQEASRRQGEAARLEAERLSAESKRQAQVQAERRAENARMRQYAADSPNYAPPRAEASEAVPTTTQESKPKQILKCRDASGAISFTQGYCPAGTRPVEQPAQE